MSLKDNSLIVRISKQEDVTAAVLQVGELARELGFNAVQKSMIATAASELAQNIIKYATQGEISAHYIRLGKNKGIEIVASDRGPGIPNIDDAMKDHFSTGGTLGLGLPGVKRMMDEMRLDRNGDRGTRVTIRKWLLQ